MIEWEDSAQPVSSWAYLNSLQTHDAVDCVSVGWLVHDGADVKALAPNLGNLNNESSMQVSGVIRIPARCITRMINLNEPELMSASGCVPHPGSEPESVPESVPDPDLQKKSDPEKGSDPESHLVKELKLQAS
jgi:hypothetical protein